MDFHASAGADAVAASEETRRLREKSELEDETGLSRRFVSERTFVLSDGIWVENGLTSTSEGTSIRAFSAEYFRLARRYPALRKIAKLGERIVTRLGGRVYRIEP